jgi:hypothetical protein
LKNPNASRACRAAIISGLVLLASAAGSHAASTDLIYSFTVNLAPLVGNSNGPFLLDLQLAPGTNAIANSVTISTVSVIGGTLDPSNVNNFSTGGVSGSLASALTLTNSSNIDNEFAEGVTAGTTQITFRVDETTNSETGVNAKNEQFNVFVDDSTSGFPIPTNDPSGNNLLFSSTLMEGESQVDFQKFTSVSPEAGATAVPEPASAAMLLLGAIGLCARRRTFRST